MDTKNTTMFQDNRGQTVETGFETQDNTSLEERMIQGLIRSVRGLQVMLDRDLAALYGVETKVLNQAVRRNSARFPEDFMFQLTKEDCSRSQIVTLNE